MLFSHRSFSAAAFVALFAPSCAVNNAGLLGARQDLRRFSDFLDTFGIPPRTAKTIFGPNSAAFDSFADDEPKIWELYQKPEFVLHLEQLLKWHLVTEDVFTTDAIFNGERTLMETEYGNITIDQQRQTLDDIHRRDIVEANLTTDDGIVHVVKKVIVPPYMQMNIIQQCLKDQDAILAFSTMANLALYVGLDAEINQIYDNGITFLVPPNRRFIRAEIDVPSLLTPEMKDYTRDFILCHMIDKNYYEASVFSQHQTEEIDEMLVFSKLGTHMWITTTENVLRFQSREVLLPDQVARNGVFHGMDFPLFPPFGSDFCNFMPISTSHDTSDFYRFFRQTLMSSEDIAVQFNSNLTLWAPTREAFAAFNNEDFNRLLEPIWVRHALEFLLNHISAPAIKRQAWVDIAPSTITMLNGATYEMKKTWGHPRIRNGPTEQGRSYFGDIVALDGYVHTLDSVITPTAVSRSVYDQCNENPDFSLLVENIDYVELDDIIDRDLPLTFLAPDNKAFRRVVFGTLEGGDIIRRHLFRGLFFHDVIANATTITSVSGVTHNVSVYGAKKETIYVGGAYIYKHDILARNGVLHFVDRVIGVDFETTAPSISPAPTVTAQPTVYKPPTPAPIHRPRDPTIITFPPQVAPPRVTDDADRSSPTNAEESGASTVSFLFLSVVGLVATTAMMAF